MDDESGDDDRDELTSEWGGESRHEWRGWRNESVIWFQRRDDAYQIPSTFLSANSIAERKDKDMNVYLGVYRNLALWSLCSIAKKESGLL